MEDKAFYLSGVEMSILASAAGIQRFYCFDLRTEAVLRKQGLQTVCSLIKSGLCSLENGSLKLSAKTKALFETIKTAQSIIKVECPFGNLITYMAVPECVLIEPRMGEFRLEFLKKEDLFRWLGEMRQLPRPCFETMAEAVQITESCKAARAEYETLLSGTDPSGMEQVLRIIILETKTQACKKKYVFFRGLLNLWCIELDAEENRNSVKVDSEEFRMELLRKIEEA